MRRNRRSRNALRMKSVTLKKRTHCPGDLRHQTARHIPPPGAAGVPQALSAPERRRQNEPLPNMNSGWAERARSRARRRKHHPRAAMARLYAMEGAPGSQMKAAAHGEVTPRAVGRGCKRGPLKSQRGPACVRLPAPVQATCAAAMRQRPFRAGACV